MPNTSSKLLFLRRKSATASRYSSSDERYEETIRLIPVPRNLPDPDSPEVFTTLLDKNIAGESIFTIFTRKRSSKRQERMTTVITERDITDCVDAGLLEEKSEIMAGNNTPFLNRRKTAKKSKKLKVEDEYFTAEPAPTRCNTFAVTGVRPTMLNAPDLRETKEEQVDHGSKDRPKLPRRDAAMDVKDFEEFSGVAEWYQKELRDLM
ncbi:hypothetical protein SAICODRAFT_225981 [Saitoella complicata NRRL Y-17804]|uniref:Uncharacterized protein n=1 Tax=Saitoella complicata (strain BCRC 22490 / CBS 7301 / JCM 7358 / NBRC 10748 / NRRL Y-17804) TaxID=698492 RepID=A0A0E9NCJ0_SAICN|nr:uncharacterized protein SAICODRAFT_225981 [Saitoella complicata NRRL Y-17804]ODQ52606.1 hypothetical protein SAICODRAFT_225981 [Saitoella complicata NRRL Y-17804]GAO47554.1 hypothetical protein G7K_1759-t1 [Saitoella complicata NRRL Y-17804]